MVFRVFLGRASKNMIFLDCHMMGWRDKASLNRHQCPKNIEGCPQRLCIHIWCHSKMPPESHPKTSKNMMFSYVSEQGIQNHCVCNLTLFRKPGWCRTRPPGHQPPWQHLWDSVNIRLGDPREGVALKIIKFPKTSWLQEINRRLQRFAFFFEVNISPHTLWAKQLARGSP